MSTFVDLTLDDLNQSKKTSNGKKVVIDLTGSDDDQLGSSTGLAYGQGSPADDDFNGVEILDSDGVVEISDSDDDSDKKETSHPGKRKLDKTRVTRAKKKQNQLMEQLNSNMIKTLKDPNGWLHGTLIDEYLNRYSYENNKRANVVYMTTADMIDLLKKDGTITKHVNEKLMKKDILICVANMNNSHWIVLEVKKPISKQKQIGTITIYDPLSTSDTSYGKELSNLKSNLQKTKAWANVIQFQTKSAFENRIQNNASDCGVYAIDIASKLLKGETVTEKVIASKSTEQMRQDIAIYLNKRFKFTDS